MPNCNVPSFLVESSTFSHSDSHIENICIFGGSKKMKKFASILLLFVLGLSLFGLYPVFKILQYHARIEMNIRMMNGVHPSEIHEIVFNENETPEWIKENKEFKHDGNLYDVLDVKTQGNTRIYRCLKDTKEARIRQQLNKLNKVGLTQGLQNKSNQTRPTNFYKFQYVSWFNPAIASLSGIDTLRYYYPNNYTSLTFPPTLPPPELTS